MNDKYYLKIGRAADLKGKKERGLYRFLEMFTGLLSLLVLFLSVLFSWKLPVLAAFFIIIFDIYWLLRTIYFAFYLKTGYSQMKKNEEEDWIKKLELLGSPKNGLNISSYQDIYHLIILPMYREPLEVVESTFNCLLSTDYPKDKMVIVLACEEADKENAREIALKIKEKYGSSFYSF